MRSVESLTHVHNTPVLVRSPLNVPVKDGVVADTFRITSALPTLKLLQKRGAKVIIVSHRTGETSLSLLPMFNELKKTFPRLVWCADARAQVVREKVRQMHSGDMLMLENLRRNSGEEQNSSSYAHELASFADYFVQDSFDVCHRRHASVVALPTILPSYAGLSLIHEIEHLNKAVVPKKPSLAIIAGAKFSTKEAVLTKLLATYDHVFVGGALANDLLRARGYAIGSSKVSVAGIHELKAIAMHPRVLLPLDVVVECVTTKDRRTTTVADVKAHEAMYDIGAQTLELLAHYIHTAKTIVWNGPLGLYEEGYDEGTRMLAKLISKSGATTILGGGDTVDVIEDEKLTNCYSFVSTGGGAMLEYLARGTLIGIEALQ